MSDTDTTTKNAHGPDRLVALATKDSGPCLACLIHRFPERFSHLYENLAGRMQPATGRGDRWSILFSAPVADLRLLADGRLLTKGLENADTVLANAPGFLTAWDRWVAQYPPAEPVSTPDGTPLPFAGGWSFYLGYELAGQIEPTLDQPAFRRFEGEASFPVAVAQYHPAAIVFDALERRTWLVHDGRHPEVVAQMQSAFASLAAEPMRTADLSEGLVIDRLEVDPPEQYRDGVRRIHDYLLAGDVFQVNLSRRWQFHARTPASDYADTLQTGVAIWQRLARHNPAPFAAWYRLPEGQIISSSPERLVALHEDHVSTRPIAGTRRRDADPERDQALIDELRAHPKERAEHVMLIDLERNDLGRVCEPGSIAVDELMVVESFAHVHHLVSNVSGRLRPGKTVGDLLAAVFPGGTITGCPKVRCMEILAELEQTGRGPYTGTLGYLSLDGRLDSNILIRTVFLDAEGQGEFRTGAGIVVDSEPARECIETEEKARGLLLALGQDPDRLSAEEGRP
jgi:anthranilate synthase component I